MDQIFQPKRATWSYGEHQQPIPEPGLQHTVTINGIPTEGALQPAPTKKLTQKEQDEADDAARDKAMKNLVQSWMDRLQLISVITTFFASTEAGLLQISTPDRDARNDATVLEQVTNASLIGALVMHVFAAIVSFLAAFFLVRYNLKEAKKKELKVEGKISHPPSSSTSQLDPEKAVETATSMAESANPTPADKLNAHSNLEPPIFSADPHLEQVGPFRLQPPTHLLGQCHSLCITLASVGFVFALVGIVCFAWARHPTSVSAFSTACLGLCLIAGINILI